MKKFEPIFSNMCFPCRPKIKNYDILHIVNYYSLEEQRQIFKTFDSWKYIKELEFGSYICVIDSNNYFIDPIHKRKHKGDPFYVGNGLLHLYFNGSESVLDSRPARHGKNEPDGLYKLFSKFPDKFRIIVLDHNLPKQVAEAEEAVLISWMYDVLGLKYDNSGLKIKSGTTRNKRRESLESVDFYLNIPKENYASK